MKSAAAALAACALLASASAQTNEAGLRGDYRYVMLRVVQQPRVPPQPAVRTGRLSFDGTGSMSSGAVEAPYVVRDDGRVHLMSPFDGARALDAGWSPTNGLVAGMSTSNETAFDWLLALKESPGGFDPQRFFGSYVGCAVLLSPFDPTASLIAVFDFQADEITSEFDVDGETQLRLPPDTGLGALTFDTLIDARGEFLLGAFDSNGVHGILYAARQVSAVSPGPRWALELQLNNGRVSAGWGAARIESNRTMLTESWVGPKGAFGYQGSSPLTLSNGIGTLGDVPVSAAASGILLGGNVGTAAGAVVLLHPGVESDGAELAVAADLDAASFSPGPATPGQLRTLFGSAFAGDPNAAVSLPLPTQLGGVSVLVNGQPAPLLFAGPSQINYQVPEDASGRELTIVVRAGEAESPPYVRRTAASSPAVFSLDGSGAGAAIVTHSDFTLVTPETPALPGEVLIAFLTGLGSPPQTPEVRIQALAARVLFAGRSPGFVGLDQLNFETPPAAEEDLESPLTLVGSGWSDTVDIAIGSGAP